MSVYTFLEARRKLHSLLSKAVKDGEIRFRRRDGHTFIIKVEKGRGFPLVVSGVDLGCMMQICHPSSFNSYYCPNNQ